MDEDDDGKGKGKELNESSSSTLLPSPVASVVSLVTRGSSLYLRLGTFIGGLALDGARVTTLTSLELSRAIIEGILTRAGRDVSIRSTGDLGKAEAEGILERSIATLHSTITNISFAASTGFHFSSAALNSAGDISQQLLATLDGILGSTDSSRAIASIITLIRREFQNPATGQEGEKVGVADLLLGICGLALLQRWCRKITDEESKDQKHVEIVWDVVILNNGRRADVAGPHDTALVRADSMTFITASGDEVVQTIEREEDQAESDEDMPEINLRQKIMKSLPVDASVSITTECTTTKTITVEITGARPPDLSPPAGVEIIEENAQYLDLDGEGLGNGQSLGLPIPRYKVVYRIVQNRLRGMSIEPEGSNDNEVAILDEIDMEEAPTPLIPTFTTSPTSSSDTEAPPLPPRKNSISSNQQLDPPSLSIRNADNIANQKRSRKPVNSSSSISGSENAPAKKMLAKTPAKKTKNDRALPPKPAEKKGSFRNALKKSSSTTISNIWNKDGEPSNVKQQKPAWGSGTKSHTPVTHRGSSLVPAREAYKAPKQDNSNYFSSRDLGLPDTPRSSSRTSYYSVHEQRRDSMVSQTDTYSIHSADNRSPSPTAFRAHLRTQSSLLRARSEKQIAPPSPAKNHRRSKSHVPSIYTLKTNNSATSLVLAGQPRSAFGDLDILTRTGFVDGIFPDQHIVKNITRYIRFASASYGASFLRVMGITTGASGTDIDTSHHYEHHSFSTHTQLPPATILLSSFVDPQGGTDSSGHTETGVPMVHFVSLDHDSKAVVLTCRGTLGFEDVLTDMTCDYDELAYRGKAYKVHKGIHASARRLLDGGGGRVMATIAAALEEFPDYGLVMCGHSLGGGVTALLGIMISEPSASTAFYTSSPQLLLTNSGLGNASIRLPPGRQIHVYAYGPPATMSPSLRLATRGLITTVVNGQDLVPYLSLGVLHDLQAVALAFKTDDTGAKSEVRKRVWEGITGSLADKWYNRPAGLSNEEDDQWAYSALKTLRASMLSVKLVPPGEVFVIETTPVLQRDAFVNDSGLGRPATRVIAKYVRDVEKKFGEVQFGGSMLLDHSPGRYEASLGALRKGVLG